MKTTPKDSKTFVTWWAMVQENPSLLTKAKHKLGPWRLSDEHFQEGAWQAVEGLARLLRPDSVEVALEGEAPWLLPGLLSILKELEKVECDCVLEWRREWHLKVDGISPATEALLKVSSPTSVSVYLDEYQDPLELPSLSPIIASFGRISCSVSILFEAHFVGLNDPSTTDKFLLPYLSGTTRARFRRLSAHLGLEAASRFVDEEVPTKVSSDEEEDEDDRLHWFPQRTLRATAVVRYLEVLRVRISSVEVVTALNKALPFMELLDDLDVHLTLPPLVSSEDVPQIAYTKDRLTLRLARVDDAGAERAGRIVTAFSRHYAHVWLTKCRMTAAGGEVFLDHLWARQTLVGAVHVFSVAHGRPDAKDFLRLTAQASLLATPTTLYW